MKFANTLAIAVFSLLISLPVHAQKKSPYINNLTPSTATAGGPNVTINVSGSNFNSNSTVLWNGSSRPTTFVNSRLLKAAISASDVAQPATDLISVVNTKNGAQSNTVAFVTLAPSAPVAPVSVSLLPTSVSVQAGGTKQFTATVGGTTNTAVTWSATGGTVNSSGLYTAPNTGGTFMVTATSVADITKTASATVNVTVPTVAVYISPTSALLQTGGNQQFTATVAGTSNTAVAWSATGGTISSSGLYTAPNTAGTVTVTASSVADGTKSASATVNVTVPVVAVSVNPTSSSLQEGASQQFTAAVTGSSNTAVSWSASGGTMSSSGLYTAPAATGTFTVKATSAADSTKSASAMVTATGSTSTGDTLPQGLGWHELPNTSICSLGSTVAPGCSGVVTDWSSGFYDKGRRRLVVTGSGHTECNNAFYAIQLDGNPAFVEALDLPSAGDATSGIYADGSPQIGHTYDASVYIPTSDPNAPDSFVQAGTYGACTTGSGSGAGENSGWWRLPLTHLHTNQTTPGSSWLPNSGPGSINVSTYGGADYDPNSHLIFAISNALGPLNLVSLNPSNGSAVTLNTNTYCYPGTNVVDPDHRRMYCFESGSGPLNTQYFYWDINPSSRTYGQHFAATHNNCPSLADWPGVDWDPVAHFFVIWNSAGNPSTNQLYSYDPVAGSCTALNPGGSGPPNASANNGTYKRFRYSDYCDCFIVVNDGNQNAFIVRTR